MIRRMKSSDIDSVYNIACLSLDEYYLPEVFSFFMEEWPSGQLVSYDPVGNVTGFICGSQLTSEKVSILMFAVNPRYRKRGIGSELLREFRMVASMERKRIIQLEVRPSNANALSFYEKKGFHISEQLPNFYNNGGNALRMVSFVLNSS
jgi:Acetyltransferases